MTRVYLIRHCEPSFEVREDALRGLSEKGLRDTALVTDYLSDKGISAVISSPYRRAFLTVEPFARGRGLSIETEEGFRERAVGAWLDDFAAYVKAQWNDFDCKLPGGESLREVQQRNLSALNAVLERHAGESIAVGGHGTAIAALINGLLPSFGCGDFFSMTMPWAAELTFAENGALTGFETRRF